MPRNQAGQGEICQSHCTRVVVNVGTMKTHKCIGVSCSTICNLDIQSREVNKSHPFANRQRNLTDLLNKN